jgi:uncharacterized protein YcbK (DUF882 family)
MKLAIGIIVVLVFSVVVQTGGAAKSASQISQELRNFGAGQKQDADPGDGSVPGETSANTPKKTPDAEDSAQDRHALEVKEITENLLASYGPKGLVSKNQFDSESKAREYAIDVWDDARKGGGGQADKKSENKLYNFARYKLISAHGQGSVTVQILGDKVEDGKMEQIKKVFRCWLSQKNHDISPKLLRLIGAIAQEATRGKRGGEDIKVTLETGFRSPGFNAILGGAKNSQHLRGKAADIKISGADPDKVFASSIKIKAGGCGKYGKYTHVDVGGVREWSGE